MGLRGPNSWDTYSRPKKSWDEALIHFLSLGQEVTLNQPKWFIQKWLQGTALFQKNINASRKC